VSDGKGGLSTATVTVTVAPVNDAPVARNDSGSTPEGTTATISVLANDSDADGDTLSVTAVGSAANGTVVNNGNGTVNYTPSTGFMGTDTFTYTISDGKGGTATATVSVSVAPSNAAPVADASATKLKVISGNNIDAVVHLDGTRSSDADGDTLTYSWFADGGLVPIAHGATTAATLEIGEHSVTLLVDDGQASDTDTIQVQVITAGEAVEDLISMVNESSLSQKDKRPLIASLKAALASFDRGNSTSGANQLHAFQNKVRAQVSRLDDELAMALIRQAQEIIDATKPQ
jgi:hypothetical protein